MNTPKALKKASLVNIINRRAVFLFSVKGLFMAFLATLKHIS